MSDPTPPESRKATPPKSPPTSQGGLQPSGGRAFAVLAYVVPLVGGIVAMAADGRNPLTRHHAQQSIAAVLTLILSFFVWALLGYVIALIPWVGPIVSISLFSLVLAMAAFLAVNWILSLLRALRGEERDIPLANRVARRMFREAAVAQKSA